MPQPQVKRDRGVIEILLENKKTGGKVKGPQNLRTREKKVPQISGTIKMGLLCAGQVFGDDDIVADRAYKGTLTCTTAGSSIYVLPKNVFLRIFKAHQESWKLLGKIKRTKAEKDKTMLRNFYSVTKTEEKKSQDSEAMTLQNNFLLDRKEIDLRANFREIINDYPKVRRQIKQAEHESPVHVCKHDYINSKINTVIERLENGTIDSKAYRLGRVKPEDALRIMENERPILRTSFTAKKVGLKSRLQPSVHSAYQDEYTDQFKSSHMSSI